MEDILHANSGLIYLCVFIGPFIQEDIAVIGAVSSILHKMGNPFAVFAAISIGLIISDLWKYWIGRAAITQSWARKYSDKPAIHKAKDKLGNNMFKTIFISRFLPGARIPLYIAAGFFKISFARFSAAIIITALFYIALVYGLFFSLGEILGDKIKVYLPLFALSLLIIFLIYKRITAKSLA